MTRVRTLSTVAAALALAVAYLLSSAPGVTTSASGPAAEGITVHGHWDIDVHEADGTFVRGTEFENALLSRGGEFLALHLGRERTLGDWRVIIDGSPSPCLDANGAASRCIMNEAPLSLPQYFNNLSLDTSIAGELELSGQATIATDTSITQVSTLVVSCEPTNAPADGPAGCNGYSDGFTGKASPDFTPVPVESGQVVTVKVTLSFS